MVDWLKLLAEITGFGPIENRYQSPEYNSQPKLFRNQKLYGHDGHEYDRMMVMMMLEKMRADRVSSNQ